MSGPAHIFYEAIEYGIEAELLFATMDGSQEVRSSAGLHFSRLVSFADLVLNSKDLLFIPGLEYQLIQSLVFSQNISPFLAWLKWQYDQGVEICSVCTGSFILAEAGLLDHKSATTHWKYFEDFKRKFPTIQLEPNRLFVSNKNLHTSAGVSSGIDLTLYLLERDYGAKLAMEIAKEAVIYLRRSESDPQLSIFLQYRDHLDQRIHTAQDYLIKTLADAPTIDQVAVAVNMSKRNLTRLFKKTLGITIGDFTQKLRVERAVSLLAEGHKVNYVAAECGLQSTNQLRNILKKHQGVLPTDIAALKF